MLYFHVSSTRPSFVIDLSSGSVLNRNLCYSISDKTTPKPMTTFSMCNKNLMKVPRDIPPNKIEIYLNGNKITTLSSENFPQGCKWQKLDLKNNKITVINRGAFVNLKQLKDLSLNGNPLREIRGDMWQGLQALVVLRIRTLSVDTTLRSKAFSNLPSLRDMRLNLEHLKKHRSNNTNPKNFPHTPKDQVKFKIEIGGRNITCETGFCFLNNMQKKGLIGGFTAQGEKIPNPVCSKDQNPFWNYSALNCKSVGEWNYKKQTSVY